MKKSVFVTAAASLMLFAGSSAFAADCSIDKKAKDLSLDEVATYYDCARDKLVAGYQKKDHPEAKAYTSWGATATGPAKPGFHSNRYLMTYVNDIGLEQYNKYEPTGVDMPIGTKIAKESFKIKGKGKLSAGPLFLMEKVGVDKAPKTDGWLYGGVKANGKNWKVSQSFCHGCHQAYKSQDALGYPAPDVRLK